MSEHDECMATRAALRGFVEEIAIGVGPSPDDIDPYVDAVVAAEMRALLALHPGGSLNYWVSRRADELEHPAVDK